MRIYIEVYEDEEFEDVLHPRCITTDITEIIGSPYNVVYTDCDENFTIHEDDLNEYPMWQGELYLEYGILLADEEFIPESEYDWESWEGKESKWCYKVQKYENGEPTEIIYK